MNQKKRRKEYAGFDLAFYLLDKFYFTYYWGFGVLGILSRKMQGNHIIRNI